MMTKAQEASITVTAFGKHPAWADHIDNLPNPGPRLPQFKSLLYTNGIDANVRRWTRKATAEQAEDVHSPVVDSHQSDAEAGIIPFGHAVRWWTPDATILGRLTPSSDSKGRKKYPLVLMAQCVGDKACDYADLIWKTLDGLVKTCPASETVEDVRLLLEQASGELAAPPPSSVDDEEAQDESQGKPEPQPTPPVSADDLVALCAFFKADAPVDEADEEPPVEVLRLLYQIHRVTSSAPRPEDWPGLHVRLPMIGNSLRSAMRAYERVARYMTMGRMTVLTIVPDSGEWVDLVLGKPDSSAFVFLRRNDLPHCTEIAYNIDKEESTLLRGIINGESPVKIAKDPPSGIMKISDHLTGKIGEKINEKFGDKPANKTEPVPEPTSPSDDAPGETEEAPPPRPTPRQSRDQQIKLMLYAIGGLLVLIILLLIVMFAGG